MSGCGERTEARRTGNACRLSPVALTPPPGSAHPSGMSTITFDTLKFVHRLRDAGFPEPQAEAVAEAFVEATSQELATKTDITAVKNDITAIKNELTSVKNELKADIEIAKRDLKIWFGTIMIAAVGIILAAIRYLPPHP